MLRGSVWKGKGVDVTWWGTRKRNTMGSSGRVDVGLFDISRRFGSSSSCHSWGHPPPFIVLFGEGEIGFV